LTSIFASQALPHSFRGTKLECAKTLSNVARLGEINLAQDGSRIGSPGHHTMAVFKGRRGWEGKESGRVRVEAGVAVDNV
jgi:hypothetical protein